MKSRSPALEAKHASRPRHKPFFTPTGVHQPAQSPPPFFQAKLRVGAPGDRFEREADRVADQVVAGGTAPPVQRLCAGCDEEEKEEVRRQPILVSTVTEPVLQRDEEDEEVDPLTEGLALTAEKALEEEAVKKGLEDLWDSLPGEGQAALISFGGLNLGMAYISLIYSSKMRENLSDVDIGAPLSLIPYVPIESFTYKLPAAGKSGVELSAEVSFADYFELLREHVPGVPITDLTLGLEGTLRPGGGFSPTGGSFGLEFLGGALTAKASTFTELSPYPMQIPGRGLEPPSMLMQSYPALPSMDTGFGAQGTLSLDLAKIFPGVLGGGVQLKHEIGAVDDPLERQADRVADSIAGGGVADVGDIRRQPIEEDEILQTSPETGVGRPDLSQRLDATRGGGEPLAADVGGEMEAALGVGLDSVRVHTDEAAAEMSGELRAHAFTRGQDIYFASGQYSPATRGGRHLLAHELTHVIQQGGGGPETGSRSAERPPEIQREEGDGEPARELTPLTPEIAREFLEDTIRFWDGGRDYFRYRDIDQQLLSDLLDSWLRMMDNGWRLIDEHLEGDEALLNRLKESYRASVSSLIGEAAGDLGSSEQELYAQHNARIAWWLRRQLAPREDIVFILGAGDAFYDSAIEYFQFTGARTIGNLRSLGEVRDWLAANPPASGLPWGDVNIVVHANLEGGMQTTVTSGGDRVTPRSLEQAIQSQQFLPLDDAVVDNATRLRIRGCALGRNQEILELLRSAFGGNEESPAVYAPVHLQNYEYQWTQPRGGERTTTSAEEYFQEFWYIGYPASPAPNRARQIEMFTAKYPDAGVDWGALLRTRGATARRPYSVDYTISGAHRAPPAGAAGAARLTQIVQQSISGAGGWTNITETSRSTGGDGRISITFDYLDNGQQRTGASVSGLIPRLSTQAEYRAFLDLQPDLLSATRPLEEGSNLTADDLFWALTRTQNPAGGTDYAFSGRRGFLRIQRDLVEPDPDNEGQTRRVRPDLADTGQFGREEPANYEQPAGTP